MNIVWDHDELEKPLSEWLNGKATGIDGIPTEILKALVHKDKHQLFEICMDIYWKGHCTRDFMESITISKSIPLSCWRPWFGHPWGYPPKWVKTCLRCARTAMKNFTPIGKAEVVKSVTVQKKERNERFSKKYIPPYGVRLTPKKVGHPWGYPPKNRRRPVWDQAKLPHKILRRLIKPWLRNL